MEPAPSIEATAPRAIPPVAPPPSEPAPLPEARAEHLPELTTDALPQLDPEPLPELEPEPLPELAPDPLPELAAEPVPELEPEPVPELAVDPVPQLEPEPVPELAVDPVPQLEPDPVPELSVDPVPQLEPEPLPELAVEPVPEPVTPPAHAPAADPVIVFADEDAPDSDDDDVPELIQDTLPDLAILAPELAIVDDPEPEPEPEPESTTVVNEEIPAWERDPTLAQLKPDLEALEAAMAFAHGAPVSEPEPAEDDTRAVAAEAPEEAPEDIPEITLDKSIEIGVESELPAAAGEAEPGKVPTADAELEKIAAEIAKARTLEDVDDKMAETLFGAEISMIAAQVIANAPPEQPANDELQLEEPVIPEAPAAVPEVPAAAVGNAPNRTVNVTEEISLETSQPPVAEGAMDLSASQRLKTVRALNAGIHPAAAPPTPQPTNGTPAVEDSPDSIEDQINTSITQTLKALKVPADVENEEPEDTSKSGFFSRFRRS